MEYDPVTQEMPVRLSLIDTMRQDMETKVDNWDDTPMSPKRSPAPTMGFSYDYVTDEPTLCKSIMFSKNVTPMTDVYIYIYIYTIDIQ